MHVQSKLAGLNTWFDDYTRGFCSDDPAVQGAVDMKVTHTRKVRQAIMKIGVHLGLTEKELGIAEIAALLHDIGRFTQYQRYRTFSDARSKDHAALGIGVIQEHYLLGDFDTETADIILSVVEYHNRATLPSGVSDRCLFFLKLLRDADKLDIWRVVTEYYLNGPDQRNRAIELDLPDIPRISEPVHHALMSERIVQMSDVKTFNDFKLLQMGWVYDLNFPVTFQMVHENGYLEIIRDALPRTQGVADVYEKVRSYVEKKGREAIPKIMKCERCGADIGAGEEEDFHGQVLCEDCYMELLSPAKACDPWAVYSAKSFAESQGNKVVLTPLQEQILALLRDEGPMPPDDLARRLQIGGNDLDREIAALRHMEKIRGELKDGQRRIRLWDDFNESP